jgi:hypothetical protein
METNAPTPQAIDWGMRTPSITIFKSFTPFASEQQ